MTKLDFQIFNIVHKPLNSIWGNQPALWWYYINSFLLNILKAEILVDAKHFFISIGLVSTWPSSPAHRHICYASLPFLSFHVNLIVSPSFGTDFWQPDVSRERTEQQLLFLQQPVDVHSKS